jgi:hypothetical protein
MQIGKEFKEYKEFEEFKERESEYRSEEGVSAKRRIGLGRPGEWDGLVKGER